MKIKKNNLNSLIKKANKPLREMGLKKLYEDIDEYIFVNPIYSQQECIEQYNQKKEKYEQLKDPPIIPNVRRDSIDSERIITVFLQDYFYKYEEAEKVALEKLNQVNEDERQWKIKGLIYQEDTDVCAFCGQKILDYSNIKLYEKYRDSQINKVRKELKSIKDEEFKSLYLFLNYIELIKINIEKTSNLFGISTNNVSQILSKVFELREILDKLGDLIEKKINLNLEIPKKCIEKILLKFKDSLYAITQIEELITTLNEKRDHIINIKNNLSKDLKEYSKYIFIYENRELINEYKEKLNELMEMEKELEIKEQLYINKIDERRREIKILKRFFKYLGIVDYEIDRDFNLLWRGNKYNRRYCLSSGEKSIIAFCYFIASLMVELTQEQKKNLIIWIDDPVSSIDYPRIFSVVTLILDIPNLLKEKQDENGQINRSGMEDAQIFISTHNDLLFNYIKQSNQYYSKGKAKVFELFKRNNNIFIRQYANKQETIYYNKLESIIEFAEQKLDLINENDYLFVPNYIRYVLEQLLLWINPRSEMLDFLERDLRFDPEESMFIKKIYDVYSHVVPADDEERVITIEEIHKCCVLIKEKLSDLFGGQISYIAATREE